MQPSFAVPNKVSIDTSSAQRTAHGSAWMTISAKKQDLIYTSVSVSNVDVYTYPDLVRAGVLTGFVFPSGLCADRVGHIFITAPGSSQIFEYAHAGVVPLRTFSDPGERPRDCSVDPLTGNLAVTNFQSMDGSAGSVSIYAKARGKAQTYADARIFRMWYCAYDNAGNLFIDGSSGAKQGRTLEFAELSKKTATFKIITLNQTIHQPGGIQWDGTYLAVGNGANIIYQVRVSGSRGTIVSSTKLIHASPMRQFWIQGPKLIGPTGLDYGTSSLKLWNYPTGGVFTKVIYHLLYPVGATMSLVQR